MRLGIIGLPQSGKTTIFNALTRGNQPTTMSGGRVEIHTAVVDVPDPRVDCLSRMFHPEKTIYAKVTYADIAGLEGGSLKAVSPVRCSTSSLRWTGLSTSCAVLPKPTCPTRQAVLIRCAISPPWTPSCCSTT